MLSILSSFISSTAAFLFNKVLPSKTIHQALLQPLCHTRTRIQKKKNMFQQIQSLKCGKFAENQKQNLFMLNWVTKNIKNYIKGVFWTVKMKRNFFTLNISWQCSFAWQGGRTWQPFVGSKNGNENFRQARIYNFRVKCVAFVHNRKFAYLNQ